MNASPVISLRMKCRDWMDADMETLDCASNSDFLSPWAAGKDAEFDGDSGQFERRAEQEACRMWPSPKRGSFSTPLSRGRCTAYLLYPNKMRSSSSGSTAVKTASPTRQKQVIPR